MFFAGNPVNYGILTYNYLLTAGRACSFSLVVSAGDTVAGHTLVFVFGTKTLTFTTATSPDDSGLQVHTASGAADFSTWAQTIFDCMRSNFEISSRFAITIANATSVNRVISFIAYNQGAIYTPVITSHFITAVVSNYITGITPVPRNGFSIIGGIYDVNLKQLALDVKPVELNYCASFNFSEYLTALLENDTSARFTFPFNPTRIVRKFTNYVLPFYAGFAEKYDSEVHKIHYDALRTAIPGGLNRETMVAYTDLGEDFFNVAEIQRSFMSWSPLEKLTGPTTPELLFFYVGSHPTYTDFAIAIILTFSDGSVASFTEDVRNVAANDVYECSVGYEQLDLAGRHTDKTVTKWAVKIDSQEAQFTSQTRTFILDETVYENEHVFIFQNSFGRAYDVVRFTGKGSLDINGEFSTVSYDSPGLYTSFNAPVNKYGASEIQKMKCNSGWISREMKDYLRDLFLSKEVYEYKDNGLYPVIITTDKTKEFFLDGEYLYNIDIEYDRAYKDVFYSKS